MSTLPVSQKTHSPARRVMRRRVPVSSITMPSPVAGLKRAAAAIAGFIVAVVTDDEAALVVTRVQDRSQSL